MKAIIIALAMFVPSEAFSFCVQAHVFHKVMKDQGKIRIGSGMVSDEQVFVIYYGKDGRFVTAIINSRGRACIGDIGFGWVSDKPS